MKSRWVYRKLRNFRAGIEANISCLKRAYGLSRCTWKGLDHFKAYVWSSVVAYNLALFAPQADLAQPSQPMPATGQRPAQRHADKPPAWTDQSTERRNPAESNARIGIKSTHAGHPTLSHLPPLQSKARKH